MKVKMSQTINAGKSSFRTINRCFLCNTELKRPQIVVDRRNAKTKTNLHINDFFLDFSGHN